MTSLADYVMTRIFPDGMEATSIYRGCTPGEIANIRQALSDLNVSSYYFYEPIPKGC